MLNKLVLRFVLALSLVVSASASAALITQDIVSEQYGIIGSISINTVPSNSFLDLEEVYTWDEFSLFGFDMNEVDPIENEFGDQFFAQFDPMNLYAGIQELYFDASDDDAFYPWEYQGSIYAGDNNGWLDIFDENPSTPELIFFAEDISLGEVSVVPEPSAVMLLLSGLIALSVRRKVKK